MLNDFKTVGYAMQGKFDGDKDLEKGLMPFILTAFGVWFFSVYNGFMSFAFYRDIFTYVLSPDGAVIAGIIVTSAISLFIMYFVGYSIDFLMDWKQARTDNRSSTLFIVYFTLSCLLITWDIKVNHSGIDPANKWAFGSLDPGDNVSSSSGGNFTSEIQEYRTEIDKIKKSYSFCIVHGHPWNGKSCKMKKGCKHGGRNDYLTFGGSANWQRSIRSRWNKQVSSKQHKKNEKRLEELQNNISAAEKDRNGARSTARSNWQTKKDNYDTKMSTGTNFHQNLIYLSYLVIILLTFAKVKYNDKASIAGRGTKTGAWSQKRNSPTRSKKSGGILNGISKLFKGGQKDNRSPVSSSQNKMGRNEIKSRSVPNSRSVAKSRSVSENPDTKGQPEHTARQTQSDKKNVPFNMGGNEIKEPNTKGQKGAADMVARVKQKNYQGVAPSQSDLYSLLDGKYTMTEIAENYEKFISLYLGVKIV